MSIQSPPPPCFSLECPVFLQSKCVYYVGDTLPTTGINNLDTLTVSLEKIDTGVQAALDAQNNFVRNIKILVDLLPIDYTAQDVINIVMALPAAERTIVNTDSKFNIIIMGYWPMELVATKPVAIFEIQNKGKGIITSLLPEDLLLNVATLQNVLNAGDIAVGSQIILDSTDGDSVTQSTSLIYQIHKRTTEETGEFRKDSIVFSNNDGWTSYGKGSIVIREISPIDKVYTIHMPVITGASGINIHYPVNKTTGNYTLATLDDLLTPPLELINEGNGNGIVIRGRIASNYGNIGGEAVDLSISSSSSAVRGATGDNSFAANYNTIASALGSSAFNNSEATNLFSFSANTAKAQGYGSHAVGFSIASGQYAHSEGADTLASDQGAHSEGGLTKATGQYSHAQNFQTEANGHASDSSGYDTKANGSSGVAGGEGNISESYAETCVGSYGSLQAGNPSRVIWVPTDRLYNIGNGTKNPSTSVITRSDAFTLLKNGLATLPSVTNALITAGSGKSIITKEYLTASLPTPPDGTETKINPGTGISRTGTGSIADPYVISSLITQADGTETKLVNGTNTTVIGNGSIGSPYAVNVAVTSGPLTTLVDMALTAVDRQYTVATGLVGVTILNVSCLIECLISNNSYTAGDIMTAPAPANGGLGIGVQYNPGVPGTLHVLVNDTVCIMGAHTADGAIANEFTIAQFPSTWRVKFVITYI